MHSTARGLATRGLPALSLSAADMANHYKRAQFWVDNYARRKYTSTREFIIQDFLEVVIDQSIDLSETELGLLYAIADYVVTLHER